MTFDRSTTVAFSGHRSFKISAAGTSLFSCAADHSADSIRARVKQEVARLYELGYSTFLCGMAEGFDLLAGEAVADLKQQHPDVVLVAVVPYPDQPRAFDEDSKQHYADLMLAANVIIQTSDNYCAECFHKRNDFLINNSSVLVCYYNGSKGGTAYTVKKAVKANHTIINIYE